MIRSHQITCLQYKPQHTIDQLFPNCNAVWSVPLLIHYWFIMIRSPQTAYNENVTYWHSDKMVDTFLMIFTDAFSKINFVFWFKCPWSLLLVSTWWYALIDSDNNLMQIRWYVITWTDVDRGHWCMYAWPAISVFKDLDAVIRKALIFIEWHCNVFFVLVFRFIFI